MSCAPTPTATQYGVVTTYTPSTSYSQSANSQVQLSTTVQLSCVASGTISGSSVGCISSTQVTQVNTIVGGGQDAQVPVVVSVPATESQPTQTLFAPCTNGGGSSPVLQTSVASSTITPLTTSILVQSTPPPSTLVETSSTTLANGSILQTVVTEISTQPATSVYVPTSFASPTLQSNASQGSGTNIAPIVGGVLGGFFGLVAIVGSLWWLCRRRRSWDDIFEKEEHRNDDAWAPTTAVDSRRNGRNLNSNAEPRPYQYGLVGHVIPPVAAGEPVRSSHYGSVSEYSGTHSRQTSFSATPLLQGTRAGSSRPSTAGSIAVPAQPGPRVRSSTNTEAEPRSLSMVSYSNSTGALLDGQSTPALLSNWTPNTDDLAVLEPLNRTGSPVLDSSAEGRVLQIVNDDPPSPTDIDTPSVRRTPSKRDVIIHTDGGPVRELDDPPAYSR